jgi:hypothetical protein
VEVEGGREIEVEEIERCRDMGRGGEGGRYRLGWRYG